MISTKKALLVALCTLMPVVIILQWVVICQKNLQQGEMQQAWRKAAMPIFEARNVPWVGTNATPKELERALDAYDSFFSMHGQYQVKNNSSSTEINISRRQ